MTKRENTVAALPSGGADADAGQWPWFDEEQLAAVERVLRSGRINQWTGTEVKAFEAEFAAYHGAAEGIALANGTLALDFALKAAGIGTGDEVIVTPRTFIASASAVAMAGAKPVFADVDARSGNLSPEAARAAVTPRTRAIIAVHLAGWPCDMDALGALARERGLLVIEDCAQAHGATFRGRRIGSFGDIAAFSFCQDKIMTTGGEGGFLLARDPGVFERAWSLKDHGKNRRKMREPAQGHGFRWVHDSLGTNGRMIELQAAIGRIQLRRLDEWLAARRRNAAILDRHWQAIDALELNRPGPDVGHAYYKYYAFVRPERLKPGWTRDRILEAVNAAGAVCRSGSCSEVYLEKAFDGTGARPPERLPVARRLGETSLMFEVHPTLTAERMRRTADVVAGVMAQASA
jgi:dTDP-4-amino-4,6-dideoxygalactose transaminase